MDNDNFAGPRWSRRGFLAAAGLSAAASAQAVAAFGQPATPASADSDAIKVLTCNIRLPVADDEPAGNGWMARRSLCADVIVAQHADLIGLQECRKEQLAYVLERMPGMQAVGLAHPDLAWSRVNAILLSSKRFELLNAGGFWLSETPHVEGSKSWDSARARFVNWAQLADRRTGGELRLWNTHFDHIGEDARTHAAEMIVAASAALPKSLPQLLTGDLNAGMKHQAIRTLKAAGWHDTFATIHGPDDPGFTAHTFLGPARREIHGHGRKIDWIFCREGTKTLAADIIRESRDGRFPSDHYFVSAALVLPKA